MAGQSGLLIGIALGTVAVEAVGIMTYSAWIDDEPDDEQTSPALLRVPLRLLGAAVVALAGFASTALVAAWAVGVIGGFVTAPVLDEAALAKRAAQLAAEAATDLEIPPDAPPVRRAARSIVPSWLYDPTPLAGPTRRAPAVADAPAPVPERTVTDLRVVPMPLAHPLSLAARQQPMDETVPSSLSGQSDARVSAAPLPQRSPLLGAPLQGGEQLASLPPAGSPGPAEPPLAGKPDVSDIPLPGPGDKYALYDIKGGKVYMPSGENLEAHSGYGEGFDNISFVTKRMIGPTPPNIYTLSMRERLFHGVEALRLKPVGDGKMYGRDGFLTHSYLMGERGDSNGCVSFKDYDKFLAAYKRGDVTRIIVVAQLANPPEPENPLLAFLSGKGK